MTMNEPLWDVLIYEISTRKVAAVVGSCMRREKGFYNADTCLEIVFQRINAHYSAGIVKAGRYQKGDILDERDLHAR